MSTDDRMETITDPAAIRATSDERGCCDCRTFDQHERECILPDERECVIVRDEYDEPAPFGSCSTHRRALSSPVALGCTTPAPVGAAVALDLDAARAMLNAANTIKATGGAVEIGGVRIEPCDEYGSTVTTARAEAAEAEVVTLRAKVAAVEAHASRLAASLALTLYDAHPIYGSTALWYGGIGGQAITAHCAIINGGPPGMEWTESDLPSMALREFIAATPDFDLDAAKAAMLTDLRAALATTGEGE